ncbi:unnamed protein product [Durusdinium trenchii]|uniref:Uncharacterized protein n=1 Tax=Durusdinium trenchii TaxID=1381693 RepID=A0ABP0PB15_9DINO
MRATLMCRHPKPRAPTPGNMACRPMLRVVRGPTASRDSPCSNSRSNRKASTAAWRNSGPTTCNGTSWCTSNRTTRTSRGRRSPKDIESHNLLGGPSSINLSWNEAPNRAPSPARVAKPEAPVGGARGASPARMLEVVHPSRLPSGVAAVPQEGAAGLAGPPAQRHPCYGDPQVHAGGAAPRAMPSYDPQAAGLAHPPAGRHPCYGDPQVNLAQPSGPSTQQARPLYDPQAPAAGAKAPAPAQRHPCYGDPQAAALPPRRTPSPCNGRAKEVPMAAAGFQAHQMHRGGAPYAYDGGPAAGLPPPLPREARAQDQPLGREQPRVSSNAYACGGNQNCGNVITDRRSTRVAQPPGGSSSICFG